MANNFTTDSSCKALWDFESGALGTDSIDSNTLNLVNSPTANTTNYKQGAASIQLNGSNQLGYIHDGTLVTNGFPLNSGDTVKKISVCCWFYWTGSWYQTIWSKSAYNANKTSIWLDTGAGGLRIIWGNGGSSVQTIGTGLGISSNTWYHVTVIADGVNQILHVLLYNATTQGYTYFTTTPSAAMGVCNADWTVGSGGIYGTSSDGQYFTGEIDEMVVFNRLLNINEVLQIIAQTYTGPWSAPSPGNNFAGNANIQAVWDFESISSTTPDSSPVAGGNGANTLTTETYSNAPIADPFGVQQGSDAAYLNLGYFQIADSALSAHFPLKSTCTDNQATICGWVIPTVLPTGSNVCWIWSKVLSAGIIGLFINSSGHLIFSDGTSYGGATGAVNYDTGLVVSVFGIYHVACVIDITNKTLKVRLYNAASGTASDFSTSIGAISLSGGGNFMLGVCAGYTNQQFFYGWLDEFVVANALLSDATIDSIREQTYRYTQIWQLTTAISITSAVSTPTLGLLWKLTAAISVASAVSSPVLGVTRSLSTAIQVTSATSNTVTLVCALVLTTAIQVYSATGGPILAVIRRLSSALAIGTSTGSPLIAVTRPFSTAIAASSTTSTPNLTVSKPLSTAISVTSAVSSPVLDVIRPQTTAIQVQSQTSIPILNVIKSLVTAIGVATSTSTPLLAVIRKLATAIQVTSYTSNPWMATGYVYLKTNIQVVSQTSTVDLGVILVPPTVIYVDFRDQRVAVAL